MPACTYCRRTERGFIHILEGTLYTQLSDYVNDWYDGINDAHEHELSYLMYLYMDAIMEFSDDYE